jgi:hypothetical protein
MPPAATRRRFFWGVQRVITPGKVGVWYIPPMACQSETQAAGNSPRHLLPRVVSLSLPTFPGCAATLPPRRRRHYELCRRLPPRRPQHCRRRCRRVMPLIGAIFLQRGAQKSEGSGGGQRERGPASFILHEPPLLPPFSAAFRGSMGEAQPSPWQGGAGLPRTPCCCLKLYRTVGPHAPLRKSP